MQQPESSAQAQLDIFKNRTLQCLQEKHETSRTYPLAPEELIALDQCPICQATDLVLIAQVSLTDGFPFFKTCVCHQCLFTFRPLSPSLTWFQKCWKIIATEHPDVFNPTAEEIRVKRYQDYYQLLKNHQPTGRLLDIGAAFGSGTRIFQQQGYQVEALETEDNKHRYIQQTLGIPVHATPIEQLLNDPPAPYDVIVFAHCLEHLDNPAVVIQNLHRLMHPQTILYLEVPLVQEIVTWSDALFLTHKSNFSEQNIMDLVSRHGFEILHTTYFQHTEAEGRDIGLVLKLAQGNPPGVPPSEISLQAIQTLYRKGLPMDEWPPIGEPLFYEVPFIQHFFYTLRLNEWQVYQNPAQQTLQFRPL